MLLSNTLTSILAFGLWGILFFMFLVPIRHDLGPTCAGRQKDIAGPCVSAQSEGPSAARKFSGFARVLCAAGLCLSLAGCSLGSIPSFGGGLWGSSKKKEVESKQAGLTEERLLAAAKQDAVAEAANPATSLCTKFKIWNADRFITSYEVGQYGDGMAVRYRGELTKAARECVFQPGMVHMKYGFAGRVLLGPKGQAGTVNLPVVVYLSDKTGKKLKTERITIPVTVQQGQSIGYFSIVRRMDIPLAGAESGRAFRVFVGFEKVDNS